MNAKAWFYGQSFNGGTRGVTPSIVPDKVTLRSPFTGRDMTCNCTRVLYWEDIGDSYRAVCCGRVLFERKREGQTK